MNKQLFWDMVILCFLTHIIRSVYEIFKHKKRIKATSVTFVIIFLNMLILWTSWSLLCSFDIVKIYIPDVFRYLGIILAVLGVSIFLAALFTIKTLESYSGDLITTGIYSKIRHPMYFAFILWLIGLPLYFEAVISFFISLLFIANILFWRHLEELELLERFSGYRGYKKKTIF